jgi:hypothetical protein
MARRRLSTGFYGVGRMNGLGLGGLRVDCGYGRLGSMGRFMASWKVLNLWHGELPEDCGIRM